MLSVSITSREVLKWILVIITIKTQVYRDNVTIVNYYISTLFLVQNVYNSV